METLLTIDQAGKRLGTSPFFIRKRIKDGSLECVRLGNNTLRVSESALQTFVESRRTASK